MDTYTTRLRLHAEILEEIEIAFGRWAIRWNPDPWR